MSAEKYQSRLYNDRCRLLYFLFNPWIIFGWCLLGNVRSASSGDASFLNLDRSSFLADVGWNSFRSVPWIMFFCRGWLMFSFCQANENMPVSAETQLRLSSIEKTQPAYTVNFYGNTEQKSILYREKILSASVCKKNCAMSAEKYPSRHYNDRCRKLYFPFNPWIIFGWRLLGNVRSASSGDTSFSNLDRSSLLADAGLHCVRSVSANHIFLTRWANVFPAE